MPSDFRSSRAVDEPTEISEADDMEAPARSSYRTFYRPQFSLRTLVVLMTCICVYIGFWEATRNRGIVAIRASCGGYGLSAPMPFVVGVTQDERSGTYRRYYLWIFGACIDTRLMREVKTDSDYMPPDRIHGSVI